MKRVIEEIGTKRLIEESGLKKLTRRSVSGRTS
jgi:hypothetical protein